MEGTVNPFVLSAVEGWTDCSFVQVMNDMVKVVAHRGFSGEFPENTRVAFAEAIGLRVDMIEFDVHLSADGELIVIHDPTVDRTSNGCGSIRDMSLSEIKALDAGAWFGDEFKGQRFLTLQEALDITAGSGTRLNVHIKAYDDDREKVVGLTVSELVHRELLDQAFVASDEESIALAKSIEPDLQICNLDTTPLETYVSRSAAVNCLILQPGNEQVTTEFVADAHAHGMEVNPFFADDVQEMQRLIDCGVDGILTNYPDRLQALLRS